MAFLSESFDPSTYVAKQSKPATIYPDPYRAFHDELEAGGYEVPGKVRVADEDPVRMKRKGSKGKPRWYYFRIYRTQDNQEIGFGTYGDWSDGSVVHFSSRDISTLTPVDRTAMDRARTEQAEAAKQAKKQQHIEKAEVAQKDVEGLDLAPTDHPYLVKKGVQAHGIRERNGELIIPMHDSAGTIKSYQRIQADGSKFYMKGGQIKGVYYLIGTIEKLVYIVEGFATGATVHELTGEAVLVAFSTSGLKPALIELRKVYNGRVMFAADNDQAGTGEKKAREAASSDSSCSVIIPRFDTGSGSDFNDLAGINRESAKQQLGIVSGWQLLGSLSVTHNLDEMSANLKNEQFIVPGMALSGQITLFVSKPNGGKTLFMMRWLSDLIEANKVDPSRIIYVNADDNYKGTHDKGVIAKQLGFKMISPSVSSMTGDDVMKILERAAAEGDADGAILVLDTLKKFVNLMQKGDVAALFKRFRNLNAKNITIILLGHANKHTDDEGKLVYEGTADVVADTDCVYYMNQMSAKDADVQRIEFGNVVMKTAYSYEKRPGLNYTGMMASIKELDRVDLDALDAELERGELHDKYESVILFVKSVLGTESMNQSQIIKAKNTEDIGKEFTMNELKAALKRFDGEIWESTRDKQNNALIYALKGTAAKAYREGSQGT